MSASARHGMEGIGGTEIFYVGSLNVHENLRKAAARIVLIFILPLFGVL